MAAWLDSQDGGSDRTAQTVLHGYPPLCSLIWALLEAVHPSKAKDKHPLGQSSTLTRYSCSKVSSEEREQDSKGTSVAPSKDAKSTQVLCHQAALHSQHCLTALSPSRLLELVRQPVPVPSAHSSIPTPGSHICEDPLRRAHHSARYRRSISCPARSWKWCCTRSAHLCGLRWCRNRKSFHRR